MFLSLFCFVKIEYPTQWQLDKWLQKPQNKSASSEQDLSQGIPEHLPSPHNQRTPSPARSWDSNQEYSPSQTPIPSPQFHYSHNNNHIPSPGYSYCPSPSPFTSTCPSPSPSPRHSPIPSPALSVCPSPHCSPRASRSPSPISIVPPKSPSPGPPAPSRVHHYPEVQSQNQTNLSINTHRSKVRPWLAPLPNTINKGKPPNSTHFQSAHHPNPKTRTTESKDQSQSKPKGLDISNSTHTHSHKSRTKDNFQQSSKQHTEAPKAKHKTHLDQTQSRRSSHSSNHKSTSLLHSRSRQSPTRAKHLAPTTCKPNPGHSSYSQSTSIAVTNSNTRLNSGSHTSQKSQAKSWEAIAPTPVDPSKTTQKKKQSKQQEVEHRGDRINQAKGRKHEKKDHRHREKQTGRQGGKEDNRLAEEQLLRRPWIESSAEEDEEEGEEVVEKQSKRGENSRRSEQQDRREWKSARDKVLHCQQEEPLRQRKAEKGGRSEEEAHPSPPLSPSPAPQRPFFSSSASSNSDSESECQASITKVQANSTSHQRLSKRQQQGSAERTKVVPPRESSLRQQSEEQGKQKHKLYTLVPFGRGDKATTSSQRGLRNLVVQIDLCLLKRVPESTTTATAKKPPGSSSSSSSKNPQEMKHLFAPEAVAKDGKRKRKVNIVCFFLC